MASQKLTCPVVNAVEPALTAAVSVTGVPDATDVAALPDAVTVRVVEVVAAAGLTVRASGVVDTIVPEVPVMVTFAVPAETESLALSVNVLLPVAGLGENEAVTPLGRPDAAILTLPAKPF